MKQRTFFVILVLAMALCPQNQGATREKSAPESSRRDSARARPETATSSWDFVNSIGLNTHLNYFDTTYGNFALIKSRLASLGVRHLRDGLHLQNPDYNKAVYSRWAELGEMGIRFDAAVDPRSHLGSLTPELLARAERLAGGSIESFEGPNELDISHIDDWPRVDRRYQESLFSAVSLMDGDDRLPVIGPSLASAANGNKLGDISRFLDFGNLHPYPAGKPPSDIFPEQTELAREVSGQKPIMITETGYQNALNDHTDQPAVPEAVAAKYIPRLYLENFLHGIPRTYLYEFVDEKPNPALNEEQQHWGLVRADGSDKPAFTALKTLIEEVHGDAKPKEARRLRWRLSAPAGTIHHLLLEGSDDQLYLVLWNEVRSYDRSAQRTIDNAPIPERLRLGRRARITIFAPVRQAEPLHVHRSSREIHLEIRDEPLVIRVSN